MTIWGVSGSIPTGLGRPALALLGGGGVGGGGGGGGGG